MNLKNIQRFNSSECRTVTIRRGGGGGKREWTGTIVVIACDYVNFIQSLLLIKRMHHTNVSIRMMDTLFSYSFRFSRNKFDLMIGTQIFSRFRLGNRHISFPSVTLKTSRGHPFASRV